MSVPVQHRVKCRVTQWKLKERKKRKRRRKRKKRKKRHLRMPQCHQKLKRRSGCKDYLLKAIHTTTTQKLEVKAPEEQVQIQLLNTSEKRLSMFLYSSALSGVSWLLKCEHLDGVLVFNIRDLSIQNFRLVLLLINNGRMQ